ncbi:hypothetical protein K492DRAFT_238871 [Lichtheimia hyalospora FSU 10163]|nr:hypothetical protein K492DRAFT_238871 [Lichtheimia hyalospora FSU 10163]
MPHFLQHQNQQSLLLGMQRFNPSPMLSSEVWNETMVTMFSPPHQSYDLMGSRKAFCFSQNEDPMLGYPRVAPAEAATATTTVVENSHDEKQHANWTTVTPTKMHANTGMESPSTSTASIHTMWPSPGPDDEQCVTIQQPATPDDSYFDSVYPSPFSPPSTGIIPVTSTILDIDADQETFSLPANINSTGYDNDFTMLFAPGDTTLSGDSTQLATLPTNNSVDDTLMADGNTDCGFSEDEDEDAYDDVFAPWPATLPHTPTAAEDDLLVDEQQGDDDRSTTEFVDDNSSVDEEEEEEEDGEIYESHPLNQLLRDLQGQVAKHSKMNESQWTGISERAIHVLTHDDGEFPPIRQCIYDCLHTLASRVVDRPIANPRRYRRQSASSAQSHNKPRRQRQTSAPISISHNTEQSIQATDDDSDIVNTTIDTTPTFDDIDLENDDASISISTTCCKHPDEWVPEEEEDDDDDDDSSCRDTSSEYGESHERQRQRRTSSSSTSSTTSQRSIPKKTRKNYSRETTSVLMNWYLQHGGKTPEPGNKAMLAEQANKTLVQVSTWFQNARRRHQSKLEHYQHLNKAYPNKVYDYASFLAFTEVKQSKKRDRDTADIETDEDESGPLCKRIK